MKFLPNTPVNLLKATKEERQQFLDSFDYLMTDCDGRRTQPRRPKNLKELSVGCLILGTVWDLGSPFEKADEAVAALGKHGKRIVYVSNNATRTEEQYNERFKASNFNANFVSKYTRTIQFYDVSNYLQIEMSNLYKVCIIYIFHRILRHIRQYNYVIFQKNDVIHPGTAAVDYLRSIDFKGQIFLIACSVFKKLLTDAGFEVITEV